VKEIQFYNRYTKTMETEQVYGENFLQWAYGNPFGKIALHSFVKRPFFSKWYGHRMNQYHTFNDFFYRKLRPEARPIANSPVVFPADGRHLGFPNIDEIDGFFVKGQSFDLDALIADASLSEQFKGGTLILSRLYTRLINGPLFSVSPIALARNLSYLWENKRTITRIETVDMGTVLMMEIGATCVGSIFQTYKSNTSTKIGTEKGYFAFGGSSTIHRPIRLDCLSLEELFKSLLV